MSNLPDEIWTLIIQLGIQNPNPNTCLTYKDLCRISVSSRRLRRLSNHLSNWSYLLSIDFATRISDTSSITNPRLVYQLWYEKEKARRVAVEKRAVMRVESRVEEGFRRVEELRRRLVDEREKVCCVVAQLNDLRKVRQASVALNVWQPEVIRGRQKQIVEQCAVPVESRINALEMELKLCKQQMMDLEKAYRAEQRRLEEAKEQLASMKYHPLPDHSVAKCADDGNHIRSTTVNQNTKRKKFKRSSEKTVITAPSQGEDAVPDTAVE